MIHYILDTNALLRFLRNDIPEQADVVAAMLTKAKHSEATVTVPLPVIMETVFTLQKFYGVEKEAIGEQLFSLASHPLLVIEHREVVEQALLFWKLESVSFVDCLVLAQARIEGKTLLTFDKKLKWLALRKNTP